MLVLNATSNCDVFCTNKTLDITRNARLIKIIRFTGDKRKPTLDIGENRFE